MEEPTQKLDSTIAGIVPNPSSDKNDQTIRGIVMEVDSKGTFKPLTGASITWLGTSIGTMTDSDGVFTIVHTLKTDRLVISFTGYQSDTVSAFPASEVKIKLGKGKQLKEVKITASRAFTYTNSLTLSEFPLGKKELFKAACCNLSESFETNPSVDVSYSDAISGSKQIQLPRSSRSV